jgi:hypothetical protein
MRWVYPFLIGLLFGFIQTGYFIRLSFSLASTYGTFLMVTLAWLAGSIVGLRLHHQVSLFRSIWLSLIPYLVALLLVDKFPFQSQWWPVYTGLILVSGSFSGLFFGQMGSAIRPVRHLFFAENNGFLLGLTILPVLYLLFGQLVLWLLPSLLTIICFLKTPKIGTITTASAVDDSIHEGTSL